MFSTPGPGGAQGESNPGPQPGHRLHLERKPDGPHSTSKMNHVKNLWMFRKAPVVGQAPATPIPNYSQEHAVPVPLTLTLWVLERGRRIICNIYPTDQRGS